MSPVAGFVVGLAIVVLGATALTAVGIYLRSRDAREQERQGQ